MHQGLFTCLYKSVKVTSLSCLFGLLWLSFYDHTMIPFQQESTMAEDFNEHFQSS